MRFQRGGYSEKLYRVRTPATEYSMSINMLKFVCRLLLLETPEHLAGTKLAKEIGSIIAEKKIYDLDTQALLEDVESHLKK